MGAWDSEDERMIRRLVARKMARIHAYMYWLVEASRIDRDFEFA